MTHPDPDAGALGSRRGVAIVTDSTADLTAAVAHREGIDVVPLLVHFGDETLVDGELTQPQFFERMEGAAELPTTSTPAVGAFERAYERALERAEHVVSIHVSSMLSGTIDTARHAAARFGDRVTVVDSLNLSWGLGWQVLAAARAARAGAKAAEVVAAAEHVRERVRMIIGLDSLENLAKGGRIGAVSAFLGGLLDLKVLLTVTPDGIFAPVARARGVRAGMREMLDWVRREMGQARRGSFCVMHAMAPDRAEQLRTALEAAYEAAEMHIVETGAVIAAHTGTGWAVAFVPGE